MIIFFCIQILQRVSPCHISESAELQHRIKHDLTLLVLLFTLKLIPLGKVLNPLIPSVMG